MLETKNYTAHVYLLLETKAHTEIVYPLLEVKAYAAPVYLPVARDKDLISPCVPTYCQRQMLTQPLSTYYIDVDSEKNDSFGFESLDNMGCLIDIVYVKEIRSLLELAVPAWHSGLTLKQSADIERVQKVAVKVILSELATGKSELTYDMVLVVLDLEPLEVRRERLCLSFAKKTLKSRHKDMFPEN